MHDLDNYRSQGEDCYDGMPKATKTSHESIRESIEGKREIKTMEHVNINRVV
jgi:hypothetical protein